MRDTPNTAAHTRGKAYAIAMYLRISKDDDARDESNSIGNQRDMIRDYVKSRSEFENADIAEYVDDGKSGESTARNGYRLLMAAVERGVADCIIVKDLSRIGRAMLDVDDLLMNYLVSVNVRLISINDGYDSLLHPLSNLELAIISLANQHYNRDLVQKSKSALLIKRKRGEYLALAPYGYKKSEREKNKLVPDEDSAKVVRLIFSLACEGKRATETAKILNAQGIPSPLIHKAGKDRKNTRTRTIDPDCCFWTNSSVRNVLINEVYLGKAIAGKHKTVGFGLKKNVSCPKDEWIVVPNTHEPLVSEEDFKKAGLVLSKKRHDGAPEHIFVSKVKCPSCGHTMIRRLQNNPHFKCGTVQFTDRRACRNHRVLQSELEKIVLASAKAFAALLVEREELRLEALRREEAGKSKIENKIRTEENAVRLLEDSIAKNFTLLVSEKLTREAFVGKKEVVAAAIAQKNAEIGALRGRLRAIAEGKAEAERKLSELRPLPALERLDRGIVDLLIEKILVHGEKDIEIVWAAGFGDPKITNDAEAQR
jgi:DNA invertase Pin-like site-specific DNA recombinase